MNVKELLEAKYVSSDDWMQDVKKLLDPKLREVITSNKKAFNALFREIQMSFNGFYHITITHMEEEQPDYDDDEWEPKSIASYWWDLQSGAAYYPYGKRVYDEDLLTAQFLSNHIDNEDLGRVILTMGEWVVKHAEQVIQQDARL